MAVKKTKIAALAIREGKFCSQQQKLHKKVNKSEVDHSQKTGTAFSIKFFPDNSLTFGKIFPEYVFSREVVTLKFHKNNYNIMISWRFV